MKNALDIFYKICEIPHPSGDTANLRDFIVDFAQQSQCFVNTDSAGNIHIIKGNPRLCLQAHYDMVLIGEKITPFVESGALKSRDSSLGADNGAAVALILSLARQMQDLEALLTNDEEIGMLGANALALPIKSRKMLNLDSENLSEIVVGCAGGFDADIRLKITRHTRTKRNLYRLEARGFPGGHSGIDIAKNIPNALVELVLAIWGVECEIVDFRGGEKRNAIPSRAVAVIATNEDLRDLGDSIVITRLESPQDLPESLRDLAFEKSALMPILSIHSGVYSVCEGNVVESCNISMVKNGVVKLMIRANRADLLERRMRILREIYGAEISGAYMPWEREDSALLGALARLYKRRGIAHKITEIHAGLECGILEQKCDLCEIVSIGPTICFPHSKAESLNLAAYGEFCEIVRAIVAESQKT